jgi:hypothetical protein
VRAGIVQAESQVDDVLARAGRQANYLVFAHAVDLRILIQSFRQAVGDGLDGPLRSLSPAQRQLYIDIEKATAKVEEATSQPTAQVRETLKGLAALAADARAALGDDPVLLGVGPAVLSPPSGDEVHFTAHGIDLTRSAPRLFVGATEAASVSVGPEQAVFAIPAKDLTFQDNVPSVRAARLMLTARECSVKVFCHSAVREYAVGLLLLPARLATVQVSYNRKVTQRVYDGSAPPAGLADTPATDKVYSRTFEYSSDDLTLMRCATQTQAPHASGYSIDTGSLYLTVKSSTGETRSRLAAVSTTSFGVELCAQAQIDRLIKTSGAISVQAAWKEYRVADVVLPAEELPVQVLSWSTPITLSLPADAIAISVQMDYFDGSRVTYTGNAQDNYLELRWDAAHGQLRLAGRDTASIEGID